MFWKRAFSALSIIALFHFSLPQIQGDSLYRFESGQAGWIISMDNSGVTYRPKCQGSDRIEGWDRLEGVIFDVNCDRLSARQWVSYLGSDTSQPITMYFDIELKSPNLIYAKSITLDSDYFYLTTLKTNVRLKCPANELRGLVRFIHLTKILTKDISTLRSMASIPKGFTQY